MLCHHSFPSWLSPSPSATLSSWSSSSKKLFLPLQIQSFASIIYEPPPHNTLPVMAPRKRKAAESVNDEYVAPVRRAKAGAASKTQALDASTSTTESKTQVVDASASKTTSKMQATDASTPTTTSKKSQKRKKGKDDEEATPKAKQVLFDSLLQACISLTPLSIGQRSQNNKGCRRDHSNDARTAQKHGNCHFTGT